MVDWVPWTNVIPLPTQAETAEPITLALWPSWFWMAKIMDHTLSSSKYVIWRRTNHYPGSQLVMLDRSSDWIRWTMASFCSTKFEFLMRICWQSIPMWLNQVEVTNDPPMRRYLTALWYELFQSALSCRLGCERILSCMRGLCLLGQPQLQSDTPLFEDNLAIKTPQSMFMARSWRHQLWTTQWYICIWFKLTVVGSISTSASHRPIFCSTFHRIWNE